MKILLVGGTGMIGSAIANLLKDDHEIITVGRTRGDYQTDIMDSQSLRDLFKEIGPVDGIISTFGGAVMGPYQEQSDDDVNNAITSKLRGQIDVIRLGVSAVKDNGFIIVTSGASGDFMMPNTSLLTATNDGIEGYVRSMSTEDHRGVRINVVSPSTVKESIALYNLDFPGSVSVADTATVFKKAMSLENSGNIVKVSHYFNQ